MDYGVPFFNKLGTQGTMCVSSKTVIVQGAVQASTAAGAGFSAVQAAHVGLVWRTSRKLVHMWSGLPIAEFKGVDPWEAANSGNASGATGIDGG